MTFRRLTYTLLAAATLALTACSDHDDGMEAQLPNGEPYISLTITIDDGQLGLTRATDDWWPKGGEEGNRTEAGFARENAVTGITLILYKKADALGFNTTSNPTLDLIRYYNVTEANVLENVTQGATTGLKAYTTGAQALGKNHKLDLTAEYYAIAIANSYPAELASLVEGVSRLSDIRDLTLPVVHSGKATWPANECAHFVMSLEDNVVLNFGAKTPEVQDGLLVYDMNDSAIPIERLAARIDFWAANSEGYQTQNASSVDYTVPGYVYKVYNASDVETADRFVVTHITPFNLNNATEYLFKRSHSGSAPVYLASEDTNPYVIDPQTLSSKTALTTPSSMLNPLSSITSDVISSNPYRHAVTDMHAQVTSNHGADGKSGGFVATDYYEYDDGGTVKQQTIDTAEDLIIAYTMENTLPLHAPLYYYATGIIIEGDYYKDDDISKREHRVYYGFLRHASKTIAPNAYDALLRTDFDTPAKISDLRNIHPVDSDNPMHFGVVRNNIYRIHIGRVYQRASGMKLVIAAKAWDVFHHDEITM